MIKVKLEHEKPMSIMAIVGEMREHGYIQHRDFDFSYSPSEILTDGVIPRYTTFTFHSEDVSSWFILKYL